MYFLTLCSLAFGGDTLGGVEVGKPLGGSPTILREVLAGLEGIQYINYCGEQVYSIKWSSRIDSKIINEEYARIFNQMALMGWDTTSYRQNEECPSTLRCYLVTETFLQKGPNKRIFRIIWIKDSEYEFQRRVKLFRDALITPRTKPVYPGLLATPEQEAEYDRALKLYIESLAEPKVPVWRLDYFEIETVPNTACTAGL